MDESVSKEPLTLSGLYIDLFDKDLPVLTSKQIQPGEQGYLYDLNKVSNKIKAKVLCGASRIYDEKVSKQSYSFVAKSPINTTNVSRIIKNSSVEFRERSCRCECVNRMVNR